MSDTVSPTLAELAERYYEAGDTTRKGLTYFLSYERLLAHRRHEPLRILELGVYCGASLLSWKDYLPRATVVGIDIREPPPRLSGQDRVHYVQGSQDDPAVLDRAAAAAGGLFDLIVDDASHLGYLTKRSLQYLFPKWLAPGGTYVIEDFGTGYMGWYPDGRDFAAPDWNDAVPDATEFRSAQDGMVGVVKQLVDYLMQELMVGVRSHLPIQGIRIETNIVFIEKSLQPPGPVPAAVMPTAPAAAPVDETVLGIPQPDDRAEGVAERLQRVPALRWAHRWAGGAHGS